MSLTLDDMEIPGYGPRCNRHYEFLGQRWKGAVLKSAAIHNHVWLMCSNSNERDVGWLASSRDSKLFDGT